MDSNLKTMPAIPRILIAATQSGSGKTTIVSGLLAALRRRGLRVCGYKIGPDYIDPGHHRLAGGCPVYNLDTWLTDERTMAGLFVRTAREADAAVAEGVMGLYDGGRGGISSSARIAKRLKIPVVLVIDARSMGESAAAVALGFREYDREVDLRGVILNRLGSEGHLDAIREGLQKAGIPLLGALRRDAALTLPERHLGLVPAGEAADLERLEAIRKAVEQGVKIDALLEAARSAQPLEADPLPAPSPFARGVRVAVARDEAFSFYYPESLAALEDRGAELVFFSPTRDPSLPDAHGLILGGGFPEVFARELAANRALRTAVSDAAARGMPIFAECGGFMYLTRSITDFRGETFEMAGLVPARCRMNNRLQTVGYVEARALRDTVICPKGTVLHGHEFHFSSIEFDELELDKPDLDKPELDKLELDKTEFDKPKFGKREGDTAEQAFSRVCAFALTRVRTGAVCPGGYARGNVLGSYLHLNLMGCPEAADRFLQRCLDFRRSQAR